MSKHLALLGLICCTGLASAADKPDREPIEVQVVKGVITVPEDEAHTIEGHGALVWRVTTPGYAFAADGIVIESKGRDKFNCSVVGKGERFRCKKLRHVKSDRYKYVVKLVPTAGAPAVSPLDPWIVND
jgi:hypothetical protein